MRLLIEHNTTYHYEYPVRRLIQLLRVTPSNFAGQSVLDWRVDVDCDARLREGRDGYGNITNTIYVDQPVARLSVNVTGRVLTEDRAGLVQGVAADLPPTVFLRSTDLTTATPGICDFAATIKQPGDSELDVLHRLNGEIHRLMRFDTEATTATTRVGDAFMNAHGVCQDFTHLFLASARQHRIPARYISGHLFRRDGTQAQQAAHAWAEAWIDDLGWVGFDPTNAICTDDAYVRVACGLDYVDASPIAGRRYGGGAEELEVAVEVRKGTSPGQYQSQAQQ